MWKVKFVDAMAGEPLVVYADDVSFANLPLVYIKGIRKRYRSIIITSDDAWQESLEFEPLIVPFHNVIYTGFLKDEVEVQKLKPVNTDLVSH